MSNKSMLIGMVAGVGIAAAGGVAAFQFFGARSEQGAVATVEQASPAHEAHGSSDIVLARVEPNPTPAPVAQVTPMPQPVAPKPVAPKKPAAAPHQPAVAPAPVAAAPAEECWDEEVTVQVDPKDQHAIAGTAVGAVVGGAIGKDVGDRDLTTAAGAAAGAFIGRKIQKKIQENRAEQRTETRIEHRCAPVGTPH